MNKKLVATATILFLSMLAIATTTTTTNAYALQFNTDTGEGFISKGELQTELGMNDSELQAVLQDTPPIIQLTANLFWSAVCIDGEIIERSGGENAFTVNHEYRTNNAGKITGIELTGYNPPNAYNLGKDGGPGDVCSESSLESWTLIEVSDERVVVHNLAGQPTVSFPIN